MTDEELVTLCQAGDEQGFTELFSRYHLPAWRVAYALTGDRSLADDVTQEAFIQAFRAIRNVRPGARFSPWFYAILVNRARRVLGRRRWWRWLPLSEAAVPHLVSEGGIAAAEARDAVWEALRRLPVDLREVLVLRYLLDWSEQEMAAALGVPPGTVKSRLYRARQLLRRRLGAEAMEATAHAHLG